METLPKCPLLLVAACFSYNGKHRATETQREPMQSNDFRILCAQLKLAR